WARDGMIDKEIASKCGVTEQTLNNWKKKFPQLFEALKRGKEVVDRQVENALLRNALGFEYEEEKTYIDLLDDGTERRRTEIIKKQALPNTTAQIFWLKNRKPAEWRDAYKYDVAAEVKKENPFDGLSVDELRKMIQDG
ncbi:MAG: helix-turn-helix domain-containing protein, partial [Aerococcus sp.]|nr:helix-turn-helix domain-containing protein [Aerococcus sp.]